MLGAIGTFLIARGLPAALAPIVTWAAIGLVGAGVAFGGYELVKHIGAADVRAQIERQDNEAGLNGSAARLSRRDCVGRGGVYQFDTGLCEGLKAGGR